MLNSSIWPIDRILSGARGDLGAMAMKSTQHSPMLQHYWSFTMRWFSVLFRTLIGRGSNPSAEMQSVYSAVPADWANKKDEYLAILYLKKFTILLVVVVVVVMYVKNYVKYRAATSLWCSSQRAGVWHHSERVRTPVVLLRLLSGSRLWERYKPPHFHQLWIKYWTSPGDSTPQSSRYTSTNHPSRKLSMLDEPDMRDTVGEVGTNS